MQISGFLSFKVTQPNPKKTLIKYILSTLRRRSGGLKSFQSLPKTERLRIIQDISDNYERYNK